MTETFDKSRDATTVRDKANIVLVGNPNSGKTTVFNALTGLRQKVGNYPGVTVEKKTGTFVGPNGLSYHMHDLPGLYSLVPKSLDEKISVDILTGRTNEVRPDLIVVVVDSTNLSRSLYLVTQVIELGRPTIVALNMIDEAQSQGMQIDVSELSKILDTPVIAIAARRQTGIDTLKAEIASVIQNSNREWKEMRLPSAAKLKTVIDPVAKWIQAHSPVSSPASISEAFRIISNDKAYHNWATAAPESNGSLQTLVKNAREQLQERHIDWKMFDTNERYNWIDEICHKTVLSAEKPKGSISISERIDAILTNRVAGPVIFILIFAVIFQSIFSWAEIPMNAIEKGVGWVGQLLGNILPSGILHDLIVDGAVAGVGAILVFLPQILFLFFFLSLLEDTGYMARVAFILDRFMRGLGLSGRSVIPLLSSFACAIPGIMATRTISNSRDRIITIMIAPLMSCSARLPVYALMIGAFIPNKQVVGFLSLQGVTLLSMYCIGIMAAIVAGIVLNKFSARKERPSTFVMELPPYRLPSLRWTTMQMWERAKIFVQDAGKMIFAMSLILWFLAYFPRPADEQTRPAEAIKQSYAGQLGQALEPTIEPLGFDWKMGIALITSFAAREVMVSTMATIYNVEGADETSGTLREALRNDRNPQTGEPLYTSLTAISLMVFFVLACQCMSTLAVVKRETNSWRWPLVMMAYMTALAYLGSLVVYQGGKFLGLG